MVSLRSLYARIRKPPLQKSSSAFYSLIRKQLSAEDAIYDQRYQAGNLSPEFYIQNLEERFSRMWITPLQRVNLQKKIGDVGQDVQDAKVENLYQRGDVTTSQYYQYEKEKLDAMAEPGSEAYINQEKKVSGLQDKVEREGRKEFRVSENLRISKLPEDSSERLWEKARLYSQLAEQARVDGDTQQADSFETQKNNYINSAKRGDINDLITQTRLSVSEGETPGLGVPTAEEGAGIYGKVTGTTGYSGFQSPAVKNALESLDRSAKTLERLWKQKNDKEAMVQTYKQAVDAASGDQKTTLTIALNNLIDDMATTDNQISITTQTVTDTVTRINEIQAKAAASAFNQEVRKNNREFDNAENELENEFQGGNINKIEYIQKGIALAETKAMYFEQVSGIYSQFDNESSADSYYDKADEMIQIHENLINVATNINDYEPIFTDKDSPLNNLLGQKISRGDVVLTDIRRLKDSGVWDQNYTLLDGSYHRVYYPPEYSDESGYLISTITSKELALIRDTAYVYKTGEGGEFVQERVSFVEFMDENNKPIMRPVSQSQVEKMKSLGTIVEDAKKGLVQAPAPKQTGLLMKAGAATQKYLEKNVPPFKHLRESFDVAKEASPISRLPAFYSKLLSPVTKPIIEGLRSAGQKITEGAKSIFERASGFASGIMDKAKAYLPIVKTAQAQEFGTTVSGDVGGIIDRIAEEFRPGDEEFRKIMHAIALAESGGDPNAVGDNGNSIGLYQNNMAGGRGQGHSIENLKNPEYNARLAAGELSRFFDIGRRKGLSGQNLTAYVSKYGQRPAAGNEWAAARRYGEMISDVGRRFVAGVKNVFGTDKDLGTRTDRDFRARNIELALGIGEGQYRRGLKQDQASVDKAFRSDVETQQLMREEGFRPSWEIDKPSPAPTPAPQRGAPSAPSVVSKVADYFKPTSGGGQNFWSSPAAKPLINIQTAYQKYTKPAIQTYKKVTSYVKPVTSWVKKAAQTVSSFFKKWNPFKR